MIALRSLTLPAFALVAASFALPASAAVDIERVVSPGGLEAWLVREDTLPMIAVSFAFRGGAAQDPAGTPGVANMLSGLLDEGAGDLDSQAFQARLDDYSISLSFNASRDAFSGRLRTLTENRDEAFRLLGLALTSPRFEAEPVDRVRAQIVSGIRSRERDPDSIAGKAWLEAAFPGHPYGQPDNGTLDSVAAIGAEDLRAYRANVFARANLKIGVVGDIDAATLGRLLDETFGKLPAEPRLAPVPDVVPAAGTRIDIDMAIPQTVIRFGGNGLRRDDPDFLAAYIANHILGGGSFSSRLYDEVREKRGLAYSVGTYLAPFEHGAIFAGGTATRADRAEESIALIESEMRRFAAEGPTEEEVAKAKSYLIGNYPLRFDSSVEIAGQLLAIQLDDLGIDYVNRRNDLIRAITAEDVRRAAARLFGSGELIVTRVGQPAT